MKKESNSLEAAKEILKLELELARRRASNHLLSFITYTKDDYDPNWHHIMIADEIQAFIEDPDQRGLMLFMPPQHGKAIQVDTEVLTTDGWKRHGDLKIGDCVFDPYFMPVKITNRTKNHNHDCLEIQFNVGSIVCSKEHDWMVITNGRRVKVEAQSIVVNQHTFIYEGGRRFNINSIKKVDRNIVNCIEVEGGMYCVGKWMIPTHNSEVSSRSLAPWLFGINPNLKIAACSYSIDLARLFNREVQRKMDCKEYENVFPDTRLSSTRVSNDHKGSYLRNTEEFEIVGHKGGYKSVGIMGGLSGRPVDIGIIDDPVKDALEANSETYRNRVWEWYLNVYEPRTHNNSKTIIIMTRWHEDDLAGRLLLHQPDHWKVIKIKAIREDEELTYHDPRKVGEVLWPQRHSKEKINRLRKLSERTFQALYQQEPTPGEGLILKKEYFEIIDIGSIPPELWNIRGINIGDLAYTSKEENDPSGMAYMKLWRNTIYIFDFRWFRKEGADIIGGILDFLSDNESEEDRVYLENKGPGLTITSMLRSNYGVNAIDWKHPGKDKTARLMANIGPYESGRIKLIKGKWNGKYITEMCSFPKGKHDEAVDVTNMGISILLNTSSNGFERAFGTF